ncbi:hypothetical protein AAG570_012510 [Ranatra chinensis]|uniref:Uncharacterized protein n=1 Tax=Ranatra chinensis TaxID=642074 RepID=A0ABD0YE46_9HEMI
MEVNATAGRDMAGMRVIAQGRGKEASTGYQSSCAGGEKLEHPPGANYSIRAGNKAHAGVGVIRKSVSPFRRPLRVVPARDGKPRYRVVVDFRELNKRTRTERCPLPRLEMLDRINGRSSECRNSDYRIRYAVSFFQSELKFTGHTVSAPGVSTNRIYEGMGEKTAMVLIRDKKGQKPHQKKGEQHADEGKESKKKAKVEVEKLYILGDLRENEGVTERSEWREESGEQRPLTQLWKNSRR